MKKASVIFLFLTGFIGSLSSTFANTFANEPSDDAPDAEFLEFLADIEELTGDNFFSWLEQDEENTDDDYRQEKPHENQIFE